MYSPYSNKFKNPLLKYGQRILFVYINISVLMQILEENIKKQKISSDPGLKQLVQTVDG